MKVTFKPHGITINVDYGITIRDAALLAGIPINSPCGGTGKCGKCRVRLNVEKKYRLACKTRIKEDTIVHIQGSTGTSAERKDRISGYPIKLPIKTVPGGKKYGLAIDLGTTTVTGALVNLEKGRVHGIRSEGNPQAVYGDDVISRINFSLDNKKGLGILQKKAVKVINSIIKKLIKKNSVNPNEIGSMAITGNTAMEHIVAGLPVNKLAFTPFMPEGYPRIITRANKLGIDINPNTDVYVFPVIGGFVGGDIVALIQSASLHKTGKTKLAIDLGTNGEIVLCHKGRLFAASTAAGPAFEGRHIKYGMRAVKGAIDMVFINNNDVSVRIIDSSKPLGICGSGLIDAASEMLKSGIIDKSGRLMTPMKLKGNVMITQKDLRELQLAKGAIYACIKILKKVSGIKNSDIDEVLIAGTFGNYVRKESLRNIKLIPLIPPEKVTFIGNSSIAGAIMALSENSRLEAERIARNTEHVELSERKDFQDEFIKALHF